MARVLITGGAGFIGSHLCESFLKQGHDVICIDNYSTGAQENISSFASNPTISLSRSQCQPVYRYRRSLELRPSLCIAREPGRLSRTPDTDPESWFARHPQRPGIGTSKKGGVSPRLDFGGLRRSLSAAAK